MEAYCENTNQSSSKNIFIASKKEFLWSGPHRNWRYTAFLYAKKRKVLVVFCTVMFVDLTDTLRSVINLFFNFFFLIRNKRNKIKNKKDLKNPLKDFRDNDALSKGV